MTVKSDYIKVTIRLSSADVELLKKYYPQNYNKILRALVKKHLRNLDQMVATKLAEKGSDDTGDSEGNPGGSGENFDSGSIFQEAQ